MVQQHIQNRGPELQAVCATFVSMAFVAMVLRLFVRLRLVRAFGWDDAWMTFALLAHIMFATCAIAGIHYGTGRHFKDLSPQGIFMAMRYWWLCYIGYCLAMIGAKISIGIFLLRVTVVKMHRWIIYTVMGLTVLTGTVFFFVTVFQCTPINFFWERTIPGGYCVNIDVIIGLTFLYSAISAICDFTYGILPIFLVWNLNMSRNSKLMLIPILSMACVASTAVVVRMAFVMDFKSNDFLYDTVDIAIWSDIEQGLAITAGSLATLRPLYRIVSQKLGLSTTNTGPKASNEKGSRQQWHPSSSSNNKRKRSGPFSLITMTRNDRTKSGHDSDEEYSLGNLQPIQIRDDGHDEHESHDTEKGFNTWRVQVGQDGSEENLNQKPSQNHTAGGIIRQTDVYMESRRA